MTVHDDLTTFMSGARWFGGKGRPFAVTGTRRIGVLPGDTPRVAIDLATVEYADGTGERDTYQLPLVFYPETQERLAHAFVGEWDDPDFGPSHVYDALHDRDAMALWLTGFELGDDHAGPLLFHTVPGHDLDLETHSTLFTGEQSNSSVAFGEDAVMKVFRRITPGVNPDIAIHDVLTRAGSDHVAALYGWLDVVDEESEAVLQLAMLQQFLRTASDGWELALVSVRNLFAEGDLHPDEVGGDFAGEAGRLGIALRETHDVLAEHFPTHVRDADEMAELAAGMHRRLDDALDVVPELAGHGDALRTAYDAVAGLRDVAVQQVHGDLHLGQTLRTVRGWKIVDFEGEPAKPLAERLLPDSAWRDVAGMLRSFDYAPRVVAMGYPGTEGQEQRSYRAREWSERNRNAFLEAYSGGGLDDDERTLLAAYVADKAVYEAVYEARNRPGWVGIPLEGIAGLDDITSFGSDAPAHGDAAPDEDGGTA